MSSGLDNCEIRRQERLGVASQAEVTRSSHLAQTERQILPVSTAVKRYRLFDLQPLEAGDAERPMPQEIGVQLSET